MSNTKCHTSQLCFSSFPSSVKMVHVCQVNEASLRKDSLTHHLGRRRISPPDLCINVAASQSHPHSTTFMATAVRAVPRQVQALGSIQGPRTGRQVGSGRRWSLGEGGSRICAAPSTSHAGSSVRSLRSRLLRAASLHSSSPPPPLLLTPAKVSLGNKRKFRHYRLPLHSAP